MQRSIFSGDQNTQPLGSTTDYDSLLVHLMEIIMMKRALSKNEMDLDK